MIIRALDGKVLPVYGKGHNIRDWFYVEDHARALSMVLAEGEPGRTYNIGGSNEKRNLEVVKAIFAALDKIKPDPSGPYERLIELVADRPGHDGRYAAENTRIAREHDWWPEEGWEFGLVKTVWWYVENWQWVERFFFVRNMPMD